MNSGPENPRTLSARLAFAWPTWLVGRHPSLSGTVRPNRISKVSEKKAEILDYGQLYVPYQKLTFGLSICRTGATNRLTSERIKRLSNQSNREINDQSDLDGEMQGAVIIVRRI
jgi:hypothetical protein